MTGAMIAQLIIVLGPTALEWLVDLAKVWNKELSPDEIRAFTDRASKSYDDYIADAKASLISATKVN